MANFAKVTNDIVEQVIVISSADCDNLTFPESEPIGQAFIASLGLDGLWLQTSYTGLYRGQFAGIGLIFDSSIGEYGEFVSPNPVEPVAIPTVKR